MNSQNMIDKRNLYFYVLDIEKYNCKAIDPTHQCEFIEAESDRDCFLKIFDKVTILHGSFLLDHYGDDIIQKYVDRLKSEGIIDSDDYIDNKKLLEKGLLFEEEDMEYINKLKVNFIENYELIVAQYPNRVIEYLE